MARDHSLVSGPGNQIGRYAPSALASSSNDMGSSFGGSSLISVLGLKSGMILVLILLRRTLVVEGRQSRASKSRGENSVGFVGSFENA